MTREEAIKEIEKAFEPAFANYIVEALTKGATVSEKEPCEDAVSRKDVLEMFGYETAIYDLPSVTLKPKMGKWKIIEVLHGEWEGTKRYACDKCGEKVGVFKSNYCPNCGADMREAIEK